MNIPPRFTIEDDDPELLAKFTAYIREIVRYSRLEYLRRSEYRTNEISLEQLPPEMLSYADSLPESNDFGFTEEKLQNAFSGLSLLRRQILTLIFVEGLSAQETADKLSCSVDYVYLQKHRILKKLRDQLMEGGDDYGK